MSEIHIVSQGETMASIAELYEFVDWRIIWNLAENESLRKKRVNPMILYPGDRLVIPECDKNYNLVFSHKLNDLTKGKPQPIYISINLLNMDGEQLCEGVKYKLEYGKKAIEGSTKKNGLIEEEIPNNVSEIILSFNNTKLKFLVGCLDPIDTFEGQWGRLLNLGYLNADLKFNQSDFELAVLLFQKDYDLVMDGILGPKTKEKLKDVYGC